MTNVIHSKRKLSWKIKITLMIWIFYSWITVRHESNVSWNSFAWIINKLLHHSELSISKMNDWYNSITFFDGKKKYQMSLRIGKSNLRKFKLFQTYGWKTRYYWKMVSYTFGIDFWKNSNLSSPLYKSQELLSNIEFLI